MMCMGYDFYELISTVDLGIATPLSIRSDAPFSLEPSKVFYLRIKIEKLNLKL